MAVVNIQGFDGGVTMPAGTHDATIRRWNANFSRATAPVTGMSDTLSRNRMGILSISGNLSGNPVYNDANAKPGVSDTVAGGSALTLTVQTGCTYAFTAGFNSYNFSVDKEGDSALDFGFVNGDSSTLTETWDETA